MKWVFYIPATRCAVACVNLRHAVKLKRLGGQYIGFLAWNSRRGQWQMPRPEPQENERSE